jgi:protein-S-isoprenylcysteine O-methyltransferase Ste14
MRAELFPYVQWTWGITGVVWLAAALATKRSVRKQSGSSRIVHVAMMVLGFGLVFSDPLAVGPLAWRLLPAWPPIAWTGLALTVSGCAFAIWARLLLGRNWSGTVTVKEDHQLMRTGPYAIVRHPIYSGGLLALLGAALVLDELRGFAGLAVTFVGWSMKLRLEEAFMIEQFGDEYARYQREVGALIPFVRQNPPWQKNRN